ncbi:hypothetical protein SLS57_008916 [Botryosphaeria dothidea]
MRALLFKSLASLNYNTYKENQHESTMGDIAFDIPKKGKAGVVVDEGPHFHVEIEDVDVPEPGKSSLATESLRPEEILIRLNATGICYSDIHLMAGEIGVKMTSFGCRSAGHEGAGVVVKLGANVKSWKVGDRAGVKPIRGACGECEQCFEGRDNYCRSASTCGLTHPGTYQQYITAPARYTTRIPDGVSDYIAGPLMCGGLTAYGSLKNSGLKTGNWVVIAGGGGGVGIQAVQLAKAMGFRPVVVDSGEDKRKLGLSRGAEAFVDFATSTDVTAEVKAICDGIGAHGVVVTAHQSYANAVSYVGERIGAVVMCIGLGKLSSPVGDCK